ncbi:hypothetical protein [Yinghuangia soli]|uniref:Tetratricopeptide repeat protein n=1 Tax=Yinghuangia soli TaxID=2908204 RepID=A0AA41TYS7_9ACTN|nr:hypothetical protein [Yinghuangia soli]MCF2528103.1 hypothetical protein [Yinghuangia soli]
MEDSEAALAGWVGLPPQILVPDAPADVVQLPAGSGPQTVRGYLERASVTRGPVLVYLTGHLMPDRRGELHVTLRDSTASSVRYDGLPWAWLAETLRIREARQTLVIADLTASADLRAEIAVSPGLLADRLPLWGVLTAPPTHDDPAHAFTRTLTVAARRGFLGCPALVDAATVHPAVFGRAQLPDGTVQIVPPPGTALPLVNRLPVEGTTQYVVTVPEQAEAEHPPTGSSGRHAAPPASPEAVQGPPTPSAPASAATSSRMAATPTPAADDSIPPPPVTPSTGFAPTWDAESDDGDHIRIALTPPGSAGRYLYQAGVEDLRTAVAEGRFEAALDQARDLTQAMETRYGLGPEHRDTLDALETWAWLTARAGHTAEAVTLYTETARRSARIHGPGHDTTRNAADAAHTLWLQLESVEQARDLGPAVVALRELVLGVGAHTRQAAEEHLASLAEAREAAGATALLSAAPPGGAEPPPPPPELRAALAEVAAIAATGRYDEALGAAEAVIDALVADLGRDHPHTLNVREVRAYLIAEAGDAASAVSAYLDIAEARLVGRGPGHPDTVAVVDNAHALWLRMPPDESAISCGERLVQVRKYVPGPGGQALAGARAHLADLAAAAADSGTEDRDAGRGDSPPDAGEDALTVEVPVGVVLPEPRAPLAEPLTQPFTAPLESPPAAAADAPVPRAEPSPEAPLEAEPDTGADAGSAADARAEDSRPARPPAEVREYLDAIKQAAADDNHVEALTLAEELTRGVEARHGPAHPFTLNAYEVRAHLTASAGLYATAARQYAALAQRLAETVAPDAPGTLSAADAAQTLWLRLGYTDAARNLGPGIVDLRRLVPGPGGTALDAARDHLNLLVADA